MVMSCSRLIAGELPPDGVVFFGTVSFQVESCLCCEITACTNSYYAVLGRSQSAAALFFAMRLRGATRRRSIGQQLAELGPAATALSRTRTAG